MSVSSYMSQSDFFPLISRYLQNSKKQNKMQLVQLSVLIGASPQQCALFCCLCNVCVKSAFLVVQMYRVQSKIL